VTARPAPGGPGSPSGPRERARQVAQRVAVTAGDGWGQLSASRRDPPDYLIVGAQRCGTTSLFKTLAQHPGVVRPRWHKGVHYFDTGYHHGPRWYRGHFPTRAQRSAAERRLGYPPLSGESSPYYLFHPLAAARIAADLPRTRLLVTLRDPVERAYSAHSHERGKGFEDLPFEEALAAEPGRIAGEAERLAADPTAASFHLQHHAYLTRGHYLPQLERLAAAVGRDRMLVIDAGDFFVDPEPVYARVLDFLGLPPAPGTVFEKHNSRARSPLSAARAEQLADQFAADDEGLVAWLGATPSWRR